MRLALATIKSIIFSGFNFFFNTEPVFQFSKSESEGRSNNFK